MLNKFFSFESPFMRAMTRLFDTTELNVLWLLCCLPVVTVGPSTVAFYSAMITLVCNEETKVYLDFFRAFRTNFKRNFLTGLLLLAIGVFLGLDVYMAYKAGPGIYTFFMVFFSVLFVLWLMIALYAFPLLAVAEQDEKILKTIALAFVLSLRHLPRTLFVLLFTAFVLWMCHLMTAALFFMFGVLVEFQSVFFAKLNRKEL